MELRKLLIAEGNRTFALALSEALRGTYSLRLCHDGNAAMEALNTFRPDVLVLDLMLPGLDGISLLEAARNSGVTPTVLATSGFLSDYILDSAQKLGVGYLMLKPCDIPATVSRIGDLAERAQPSRPVAPDPRTALSNILLDLGIPTRLRGYGYLREAILLMARAPGQSITKQLYPAVAALCGAESVAVERAIRSAIAAAWKNRDGRVWQRYFGGQESRPSNGEFICRMAEHLVK